MNDVYIGRNTLHQDEQAEYYFILYEIHIYDMVSKLSFITLQIIELDRCNF